MKRVPALMASEPGNLLLGFSPCMMPHPGIYLLVPHHRLVWGTGWAWAWGQDTQRCELKEKKRNKGTGHKGSARRTCMVSPNTAQAPGLGVTSEVMLCSGSFHTLSKARVLSPFPTLPAL